MNVKGARVWKILLFLVVVVTPELVAAQGLEALVSPGELSQAHESLSGIANCAKCHVPGEGVAVQLCLDCHQEIATRVENRSGFHRDKAEDCQACHPEHRGRTAQIIPSLPTLAEHWQTGYPLTGLHSQVQQCEQCHSPQRSFKRSHGRSFLLSDHTCTACHDDTHRGQLGSDCARCHRVETRFKETPFDHSKTAFLLEGAHRTVACSDCHENKTWTGILHEKCTDCHTDPHQTTLGPNCLKCHSDQSWKLGADAVRFDHTQTRFSLKAAHAGLECRSCHQNRKVFRSMPFEQCRDCHTYDPHFGQFDEDCSACHTEETFKKHHIQHEEARFPLLGRHSSVECAKCHPVEVAAGPRGEVPFRRFKPLSTVCASCHEDIHYGQLNHDCGVCHSPSGFDRERLNFVHDRDSRFKLTGKHSSLACQQCHKTERASFPSGRATAVRFIPINSTCASCHEDEHVGQLGNTCETCHGTDVFKPASGFRHAASRFPLTGKHVQLACSKCHLSREVARGAALRNVTTYRPLEHNCRSCHSDPHRSPVELDCAKCHSPADFTVSSFNHFETAFPLEGRHRRIPCARCHPPAPWKNAKEILTFDRTRQDCAECHVSRHRSSYSACGRCHGFEDWRINDW